MLKPRPAFFIILILIALCTCIDPYVPNLKGYESLLVVDGLITNINSAYSVKLSRTFQDQNSTPMGVSDASVFITDDIGNISNFSGAGNGMYKSDSLQFRGIIGRTYVLHIRTQENEEYTSEPCTMLPVPEIDSIYFGKDQKMVNNQTVNQEGINIYLDSKGGDNNQYYRWTYDETWKFRVPTAKKYDFLYLKPGNAENRFVKLAHVNEFCWKDNKSSDILIHADYSGEPGKIIKEPILFIASDKSDRLMIQYSVIVNQLSISKNEYEFWNDMKKVNEAGGDIFAKQPFSVISNIKNTSNPGERVLGYFQVSAVAQKRKYISFNDVATLDLPFYSHTCATWEFEPANFDTPQSPPKTWDDVYWYLCVVSDYTFIEPKFNNAKDTLKKMVFTRPECADCELYGTSTKPAFFK